ncbi:MAG TPA: AAA family ATPase [Firmicutes bacterium]|nr:AAA family ATPase [Candidatus Fermentithermobacillaceae bacterium]
MKLRYLLPAAFGKFHLKEPIVLQDGLNLIVGDNEAGKSTLEAFIHGMLYGFKKEGKSRISRLPEFDRYRPWSGSEYRGVIGYEADGANYRVERSFDPDLVRIYDDDTGEDITRRFSQDSRKEYDFAQRHLGLSAMEFRNTVWIRQLGSTQEPGLGTEIQGKLGDILQGGAEDVSLTKALSALIEERNKIKSPRSTKQRLDVVMQRLAELKKEAQDAAAREEQVRDWLIEASSLSRNRDRLEEECRDRQADLDRTRYLLLADLLAQVTALDEKARGLRDSLAEREWAKDLPKDEEGNYKSILQEKESLSQRCREVEAELDALQEKAKNYDAILDRLSRVQAVNVDAAALASMYTRYLSAKATASKSERVANDARKELRAAEEETETCGLLDRDFNEETIKQAEELQSIVQIAEKQKDSLAVEAERTRAQVLSRHPGGTSGWLYGLSLGVLAVAVVFTVMGWPVAVPAFAVAVAMFAFGLYRQSRAAKARRDDEAVLAEKERFVKEQEERVEEARRALSQYLAGLGVSSPEQLRALSREAAAVRARLKNAKDKYEVAQNYWFEASQEYAAAEKELLSVLRSSGTIGPNEYVSDSAVESLKRDLSELASAVQGKRVVSERLQETRESLGELRARLEGLLQRESALLASAKVSSAQELMEKARAKEEYDDLKRSLDEVLRRREDLLMGRSLEDLVSEMRDLEARLGEIPEAQPLPEGGQKAYEEKRQQLDEVKARLAEINSELASIQRGIKLRSEEGRSLAQIEEETARYLELESEMSLDRDALDLAYSTLEDLSKGIRREFAPALNQRVGEILAAITNNRYQALKVSADLQMSVAHPDTGNLVSIDALSAGTLDQCYFALRVAIAEVITKKDGFPLFLDDSFVQYDDRRLEGVLQVLSALAARHQILLFSCHGREEALARKLGLSHHLLKL